MLSASKGEDGGNAINERRDTRIAERRLCIMHDISF